jgi:hypothetical protein
VNPATLRGVSHLRVLIALVVLEGLGLVALGVVEGVAGRNAPSLTAAAFAVLVGFVLLLLARVLSRGRPWARGPVVALNLFPVLLGVPLVTAGTWWVGVPLVMLGASVLWLFTRPDLRARYAER